MLTLFCLIILANTFVENDTTIAQEPNDPLHIASYFNNIDELLSITGDTLYVPKDYNTIQEAIDSASNGDLILVSEGIYKESIYLNKYNITLCGAGVYNTLLNGMITIQKPARIEGFTIRSSGYGQMGIWGIQCLEANAIIQYNIITTNDVGIQIASNPNDSLFTSTIPYTPLDNNPNKPFPSIISNNIIINNKFAGIMVRGEHTIILNNTIIDNAELGIALYEEANPIIINNIFYNNGIYAIRCFSANILGGYNLFWENRKNYGGCEMLESDLEEDPQFKNILKEDYKLLDTSPALNYGYPICNRLGADLGEYAKKHFPYVKVFGIIIGIIGIAIAIWQIAKVLQRS